MHDLESITLPKYQAGLGTSPSAAGPYGEVFASSSNSNPYDTDFFGFGIKSLFQRYSNSLKI